MAQILIKFVLNRPFAAFPSAIGSGYFGMASPAAVKKAGAKYGTPGLFVFQEWRSGDRIVLEKIRIIGKRERRKSINS